jgi:hypothetical protein
MGTHLKGCRVITNLMDNIYFGAYFFLKNNNLLPCGIWALSAPK